MRYGTVYLHTKSAPGGTDWHQGYLRVTASGVFVHRDTYTGANHYYPNAQIERVSF
jgi:predicted phage gp36 major capsid-like protein